MSFKVNLETYLKRLNYDVSEKNDFNDHIELRFSKNFEIKYSTQLEKETHIKKIGEAEIYADIFRVKGTNKGIIIRYCSKEESEILTQKEEHIFSFLYCVTELESLALVKVFQCGKDEDGKNEYNSNIIPVPFNKDSHVACMFTISTIKPEIKTEIKEEKDEMGMMNFVNKKFLEYDQKIEEIKKENEDTSIEWKDIELKALEIIEKIEQLSAYFEKQKLEARVQQLEEKLKSQNELIKTVMDQNETLKKTNDETLKKINDSLEILKKNNNTNEPVIFKRALSSSQCPENLNMTDRRVHIVPNEPNENNKTEIQKKLEEIKKENPTHFLKPDTFKDEPEKEKTKIDKFVDFLKNDKPEKPENEPEKIIPEPDSNIGPFALDVLNRLKNFKTEKGKTPKLWDKKENKDKIAYLRRVLKESENGDFAESTLKLISDYELSFS